MSKKKKSLSYKIDKKLSESKFDFCKNLKYFLIAPILILIVGVVFCCTLGFNLGSDFSGSSIVKVYSNDQNLIEGAESYDLNKSDDFNAMQSKVENLLSKYNFSIISSVKTTMDSGEFKNSQVMEIEFNSVDQEKNDLLVKDLQEAFKYQEHTDAVGQIDLLTPRQDGQLFTNICIAILVAMMLVLIYFAFRFDITSAFAGILAFFHDLLIAISATLIFRLPIGTSLLASIALVFGFSILNSTAVLSKIRENTRSGNFVNAKNNVIANASIRQSLSRVLFTSVSLILVLLVILIIGVNGVRWFAIPAVCGGIASVYSAIFITPALWAIAYREPKRKKKKATAKI